MLGFFGITNRFTRISLCRRLNGSIVPAFEFESGKLLWQSELPVGG
jgi:hypothetical protein